MNAPMDAGLAAALATLGLRPDADSRSVRRAYAQQVKQIEQATQLQAFQTLREAYELALAVISLRERQARDVEPTPATAEPAEPVQPPAPPASADFAPTDSADLARAVYQGFAARADAGFKEEAEATSALQDALADDRLLNLEARTLFELQVAHRIMQGWQPGHEFLFGPACEVFHWETDRNHLRVFGQLGAALDAAINEKMIFFRQSPRDFDLQRNVIRRLRKVEMPSASFRRADMPLVQMLVQRYPNWLRLITSQANINTWFVDLPDAPAPAPSASTWPVESSSSASSGRRPAKTLTPWLIGLFVVFMLAKLLGSSSTPSYRPSPGLGGPQSTMPSGPPISTWPPATEPAQDSRFVLGTAPQRQLYDLPPPTPPIAAPVRERPTTTPTPPAQTSRPVDVAAVSGALQEANDLPPPTWMRRPPVEESVQIGHATFVRRDGQVVVADLGERSRRSFSTLQPGDRLLGCMSGNYHLPLILPAEARRCVATVNVNPEPGVTIYMFRTLRNGQSVPASLTLRDDTDAPAQSPAPAPPLQLGAPG